MTEWLRAIPEIALVVAVLSLPGLLLAVCLRFRRWDAVALATPLSLGILTLADIAAGVTGVRWGLPAIALSSLVIAAVAYLATRMAHIEGGATDQAPSTWTARGSWIASGLTAAAMLVGVYVAAKGIGSPEAINQTVDGAFHVNSIEVMAQHHSAMPSVFGHLTGRGADTFYPPLFAGVASLLVTYTSTTAIAAANITAVAMALLWPLTVSIAVRRFARTGVFGYGMAMVAAVTVTLFPALLLSFGTLWPNALSYLGLAAGLVLLTRVLGLGAGPASCDQDTSMPWLSSLAAGGVVAIGMTFAHPGALFLVFYLAIPAVIWCGWRVLGIERAPLAQGNRWKALGAVLVAGVLFEIVVECAYLIPSVASLRRMYWPPLVSWPHAILQVLTLESHLSAMNLAMGVLVVVGLVVAWRTWRGRYLVAAYGVVAVLAVATAGIESRVTMHWTGFWYNDPYRLFAALPVLVLPLVAMGAEAVRSVVSAGLDRARGRGLRLPAAWTSVLVAGVVVCAGVVAFQGGLGVHKGSALVAGAYRASDKKLVTRGEAQMFKRLKAQIPAGMTIAGDPFSGAILAGVLSGHPMLYDTFGKPVDPDRALVARKFRDFRHDPKVCAAVKRLKISVVIAGRRVRWQEPEQKSWYAGFTRLGHVPGLTRIDGGGGVQAFRVGPCNSNPR